MLGPRQIVHTQIRRRSLLRLIGAYTILQETNNFQQNNHPNLSPCWDPANTAYPDQTPQLARLIGGLHHPPGNKINLSKITIHLSLCWEAANNVYPDQTPQLVEPNRGLHHTKEANNSQQNNHPNLSPCSDPSNSTYQYQTLQLAGRFGTSE